MSLFWFRQGLPRWSVSILDPVPLAFTPGRFPPLARAPAPGCGAAGSAIAPLPPAPSALAGWLLPAGGFRDAWLLIAARPGLRVNGSSLAAASGVRVLRDRDSIEPGGGEIYYFSSDRPARIEPFPGPAPARCPRCTDPLRPGTPAVRAPCCGIWAHEVAGEKACWSYADRCAACGAPAGGLGAAGIRWSPEGI